MFRSIQLCEDIQKKGSGRGASRCKYPGVECALSASVGIPSSSLLILLSAKGAHLVSSPASLHSPFSFP